MPFNPYRQHVERFTSEQLGLIAQVKRVFEWYRGDRDFRRQVDEGAVRPQARSRLRDVGVTFAVSELALIWEAPRLWNEFLSKAFGRLSRQYEISDETATALARYPLLDLWARFYRPLVVEQAQSLRNVLPVPKVEAFDLWRKRQVAAVRSELGSFGYQISYPLLAFELSDGCSMGCWFCAFATRKLGGVFDYEKDGGLFREIVRTCVDLFGRREANAALLYYGTEPHDNPHYVDFLRDYEEIAGRPPCTATAVTTDAKWVRDLVAFYRKGPHPWPRLSVLARSILFKIHELFSPDELRDVELMIQSRESIRRKVPGGRILEKTEGLRGRKPGHYFDEIVPQGSISCVSGFLVNMVTKKIRLVSPCYACDEWPLGYRIFDEAEFTDAGGFRSAIGQLTERNMPTVPQLAGRLSFRDDLVYRDTEGGFELVSPNQVHRFQGGADIKLLGSSIAAGDISFEELRDRVFDAPDVNPIRTIALLRGLFDNGLLNEVIAHHPHQGS